MNDNERLIINLTIFGCIALIILFSIAYDASHINCYTKEYVLIKQYIGKSDDCKNGCLMMNVREFFGVKSVKYTFYFVGETKLRNDLKPFSIIKVRWCYNNFIKDYRIRGVWEKVII